MPPRCEVIAWCGSCGSYLEGSEARIVLLAVLLVLVVMRGAFLAIILVFQARHHTVYCFGGLTFSLFLKRLSGLSDKGQANLQSVRIRTVI